MSLSRWWSELTQSQQAQWQDPYYRFESIAELQAAAAQGIKLDVNRASVDDWLRLPGLSIHQARSLAVLSQSGVQFHCLEDLAAALSLPVSRLLPLAPILQFCYYDRSNIEPDRISLNRASVKQLSGLPAVDFRLAAAIVADRQQRGAYRNLVDLQQRLQLSGQVITELMHYLSFE